VNWGKQHSLSMSSIIASISKTFTDKMVLIHIVPVSGESGPKDQVALQSTLLLYFAFALVHDLRAYRNCKFHNGCRTISRHADGISRYSVPPSAGPLLPLVPVDTKQRPGRKVEYCYERVCLYRPKSVSISVYLHAYL